MLNIEIQHHDYKQEEHHHCANINQNQGQTQELSLEEHPQTRSAEKSKYQEQCRMNRVTRCHHTHSRNHQQTRKGVKEEWQEEGGIECHLNIYSIRLTIRCISGTVGGNIFFVAITYSQEHFFCEIQITALITKVFKDIGLNNGIDWTSFFAETTENTLS